jgi:hypothetical protein
MAQPPPPLPPELRPNPSAASAHGFTPVELQMARILVDAGATHASAARAAIMLQNGATIREARESIVLADQPAPFDVRLLFAEAARERELVLIRGAA